MRNPIPIFAGLCVACAVGLGGYFYWATKPQPELSSALREAQNIPPEKAEPVAPPEPVASSSGRIFFRYNALDSHYGKLAFVQYPLRAGAQPEFIDSLACDVAYVAGGRGVCLTSDRGALTTYNAELFDSQTFKVLATIPLHGIPSRCRVSRDGKLAALTVFLSGHGYAALDFSTETLLLDLANGQVLANVEDYSVTRGNRPFRDKDFNFWGVTFTPDGKEFYSTLSTGGRHFLVKSDIASRSAIVIHDNVECPSLSPDATRIAYKKRFVVNGRIVWQLHVLSLQTGVETPLAERRSADDQLEWLDDERVLYALPENELASSASLNVWVAAADGKSAPEIFLKTASSPSVER